MGKQANFYEIIQERRAVRYYDPVFKISDDEIKELISEAMLAPNNSNMHSWRFMVLTDQAQKDRLAPVILRQKQVLDASAIIAVLGDKEAFRQTENIYQKSVEAGYMTAEAKEVLQQSVAKFYEDKSPEDLKNYVLIDGGLVAMQLMLAAKARGFDTLPMLGYDSALFRQAFHVPDRYHDIMLIVLGKAAQPGHPTIRLSVDEVTSWNEMKFRA